MCKNILMYIASDGAQTHILSFFNAFGPQDRSQSLCTAAPSSCLPEMPFLDAWVSRYRDFCRSVIKSTASKASPKTKINNTVDPAPG